MNTKIDAYLPHTSAAASVRAPEASGRRDASPVAAVVAVDTLSLTRDSKTLQDVQALAAQQPDIDAERVARIRQQVLEGRYVIDPQTIARQLLHLEWQLGA